MEGPHYFDDDAYTDMPEKELVAEVIREKALLFMRDEIPHGIAWWSSASKNARAPTSSTLT